MSRDVAPGRAAPVPPDLRRDGEVPVLRTEDLFRGSDEVRVVHAGNEYRLRITRQGKLILTK